MNKFCKDLKKRTEKITNYGYKEMISLTDKKPNHIISKKFVKYAKKDLVLTMTMKNIIKLKIIVIILENIEEVLVIFVI